MPPHSYLGPAYEAIYICLQAFQPLSIMLHVEITTKSVEDKYKSHHEDEDKSLHNRKSDHDKSFE